jgi:hypothetical protein
MLATEPSSELGAHLPVVCSANNDDEPSVGYAYDQVIAHLFDCGLGIASVLGDGRLDTRSAERLLEVRNHLDGVIRELRMIVLTQLGDRQL